MINACLKVNKQVAYLLRSHVTAVCDSLFVVKKIRYVIHITHYRIWIGTRNITRFSVTSVNLHDSFKCDSKHAVVFTASYAILN